MIPLGCLGLLFVALPVFIEAEGQWPVMLTGAGIIIAAFIGAAAGAPLWPGGG
jgi:hypothetical protein